MPNRRRATLRSLWWKNQLRSIRHCFSCGGHLRKKYVPAEHTNRLVCSACHQITYLNPKVVAGVIPVMPDGSIVLLQREIEPAKGQWSYPAGYQELRESVQEAAARETWEEICVRVKIVKMIGIYSYSDAGVVTVVFFGKVKRGERPRPGIESQSVHIFKPHQIPWKKLAFRSTRDALKDWLRNTKRKEA